MVDAPENTRANKGKPRQTTNRHGYFGDWTEPKLLTIYVVDAQGKRVNTTELPVTNDGTFGDLEQFMELLETHLVSLGISQTKQVLLLADGAEWIWLRLPPLLQRLGCPAESIVELLDFYHATEHLYSFAELASDHPQAVQTWFKTARVNLKRGHTAELISQMQAMVEKASGERQKLMAGELAYFTLMSTTGAIELLSSGSNQPANRQWRNCKFNPRLWLISDSKEQGSSGCCTMLKACYTLAVSGRQEDGQLFVTLSSQLCFIQPDFSFPVASSSERQNLNVVCARCSLHAK